MGFFHPEQPVSGPGQFFGREQLVRSLVTGLQRGRPFALCGGPRTGKTSTILQVESLVRERWEREPQAPKLLPVRVDLAELGRRRDGNLFALVLQALAESLHDPHLLGGAQPPKPTKPRFNQADRLVDDFLEASRGLLQPLIGTPGWCRYVLLLDHVDLLLCHEHAADVHALDALMQHRADEAPLATLLAGGRTLREQLYDRRAPLHMARPVSLGIMRLSEAQALLSTGLSELDAEAIAMIFGTTGRHPYLLQRLGAELELQQGGFDVLQAAREASRDAMQLFEAIWAAFDFGRHVSYRGAYAAPEHALMQFLIGQPVGATLNDAEQALGIRSLREHAELLEILGVAERNLHQDVPVWQAPNQLWNSWYLRRITY